jgi:hypothetical protein
MMRTARGLFDSVETFGPALAQGRVRDDVKICEPLRAQNSERPVTPVTLGRRSLLHKALKRDHPRSHLVTLWSRSVTLATLPAVAPGYGRAFVARRRRASSILVSMNALA